MVWCVLLCMVWCDVWCVVWCDVWCVVWCIVYGVLWCVVWRGVLYGVWCIVWCVVWCVVCCMVCGVMYGVWCMVWCAMWCVWLYGVLCFIVFRCLITILLWKRLYCINYCHHIIKIYISFIVCWYYHLLTLIIMLLCH